MRTEERPWGSAPRSQAFTYDDDGNLTSDGLWNYSYDAENRLITMTTTLEAKTAGFPDRLLEFKYDYLGRRVQKRSEILSGNGGFTPGVTYTRYLYDGWNLVAEFSATSSSISNLIRTYAWGLDQTGSLTATGGVGALLQISDHVAGKTYFPAYDGNGNIIALILGDTSSAGAVVAKYEYSPFGELLRMEGPYAASNPFRFSTKFTDDETGLVYYGLRYYSPTLGRFINHDPIEEQGGFNLYGFVGNDPANQIDILGMTWIWEKVCYETRAYQDGKLVATREDCEDVIVWMPDNIDGYSDNVLFADGNGGESNKERAPAPTQTNSPLAPNNPQRNRDDCFVYDTVDAQGNVTGTVSTPKTADGSGKAMEGQPMFVPPQADIYANIESARWMNPIGFYNSVKTGGVWDYKQTDFVYMPYGNFHFGVVGRANGWGATALLVGGGQVSQDREFGQGRKLSTGRPVEPYGDSWFDNAAVKAGISFYNENYSSFFFTGFASEKSGATKLVKRPCNDSEFAAFQAAPTSGK